MAEAITPDQLLKPVSKEDSDRLRVAIREGVVRPLMERRKHNAELVEAARRRIVR